MRKHGQIMRRLIQGRRNNSGRMSAIGVPSCRFGKQAMDGMSGPFLDYSKTCSTRRGLSETRQGLD